MNRQTTSLIGLLALFGVGVSMVALRIAGIVGSNDKMEKVLDMAGGFCVALAVISGIVIFIFVGFLPKNKAND